MSKDLTHLQMLEAESIHIIREVVAKRAGRSKSMTRRSHFFIDRIMQRG
jgi:hypothetical protein